MSNKKQETNREKLELLTKKIWLAGLGAAARSVDEAQDRYDKLSEESRRMFDDLANKGEGVQADTKDKFKEHSEHLEERIEAFKQRITSISDLDSKIDDISSKLDGLRKK